jgi:hypothetical protein
MRRVLGVGVVLLLLLSPQFLSAQGAGKERRSRMGNYPNPFNPTTTITFPLVESDFRGGRPAKVTILILNVLQQEVAVPLAMDNPAGNGPMRDMIFTQPGNYRAFWDGTDRTGRKVASGIYYAVLVVNGERDVPRRLVVTK